jgi:hypothetical protein
LDIEASERVEADLTRLVERRDAERLSTDVAKALLEWAGVELQEMAVSWSDVIERVLAKGVVSE